MLWKLSTQPDLFAVILKYARRGAALSSQLFLFINTTRSGEMMLLCAVTEGGVYGVQEEVETIWTACLQVIHVF